MVFFQWFINLLNGLWHVLDFDPFGFGINVNMLFLGLSLFVLFVNFFRFIVGLEGRGLESGFKLIQSSHNSSKKG